MSPAPMKRYTLAQAAEILGRSADTLRHQAQSGALRAELIGKTYVVTERELERYREASLGRAGRKPKAAPRPARRVERPDADQPAGDRGQEGDLEPDAERGPDEDEAAAAG